MGGGEVVPGAAPREDLLEGHVRVVGDRAVGVAGLVVRGEVVVDRLAVGDPVGADHARVADVDHVRVGHVQGDATGDQHDGHHGEHGDRHRRPQARALSSPEPEPERSAEQVEQRRVGERDREPDVALVEEVVGEPEAGDDHQQVEMGEPERAAPVEQPEDEDRAEGEPDVRRVHRAAEGPRIAPRHAPGDLVARPGLEDVSGVRVDHHLDDLVAAGEEADLPEAGGLVPARRRGQVRVLLRCAAIAFGSCLAISIAFCWLIW